jgi:hypothetical protein
MANQDSNTAINVTPYQSTVPVVSIPPDAMNVTPAQPLQGQFGKKGTGALAIGDAIVKGLMQGHAIKEQRKAEQANAQINIAQNAERTAWDQYQQSIASGKSNPKDPNDPYYQAYLKAHQGTSDTMAKYTIPEKPTKSGAAKGQQTKKKDKAEGDEAKPQTFGQRLKDFFEANPHIVPQLAIATRMPNPPGMAPETLETRQTLENLNTTQQLDNLKLQEEQRKATAQKVYDMYSGLTDEQRAALPPKEQQAFQSAKNVLFPPRETGTTREYVSSDGAQRGWYTPGFEPQGWQPVDKPQTGTKPGTFGAYVTQYAKANNISVDNLTTADYDYLRNRWQWDAQQNTSTSSTVSPGIDKTTTATSRRKGAAPAPPEGRVAVPGQQPAAQGTGGMTAPPAAGGGKSQALNPYPNPEDRPPQESFAFNKRWAKPGPYTTTLNPSQEEQFKQWAAKNPKLVECEVGPAPAFAPLPQADYDVRGHWLAAMNGDPDAKLVPNKWDGKLHGSDKWKTPYDGSFSNESIYATPNAPRWVGNKLMTADGRLVTDETPKSSSSRKQTSTAASGRMQPPPRPRQPSLRREEITAKVIDEKAQKYQKIRDTYNAATLNNQKTNAGDPKVMAAVQKQIQDRYDQDAKQIEDWYNQRVHAIGGTVPSDKKYRHYAKNGSTIIGSDNGSTWYNVQTGQPYVPPAQ